MKYSQDIFERQYKPKLLRDVLRMVLPVARDEQLELGNNLEVEQYKNHIQHVDRICTKMGIIPSVSDNRRSWIVKFKINCWNFYSFFANLLFTKK